MWLGRSRRDEAGRAATVVGVVVVVLVLLALVVGVVAFAFSVTVQGHSMEPTLHPGDRLEVDVLHRHDLDRFDLVEAVEPSSPGLHGGADIVKRVIGMPGDRVAVTGGPHPVVHLRPAGSRQTYVVESSSWSRQVGDRTAGCCRAGGTAALDGSTTLHWVTVPAASYWLIGDNWGGSTDSRVFGFVPEQSIKAKLWLRLAPWSSRGRLANPARLVPAPA